MTDRQSDSQSDPEIRRATLDDIDGLADSSSALLAEDAGKRDSAVNVNWSREAGTQRFVPALADPAKLLLVAVDEHGRVVGHLSAFLEEPSAFKPVRNAVLQSVYVCPERRGRRVGERLVTEFFAWARAARARRATVSAYQTNTAALRFYERRGFAPRSVTWEAIL